MAKFSLRKFSLEKKILIFFVCFFLNEMSYAQIPQDHNYQIVLKEYLESFETSDFEIELNPLQVEEGFFKNDEDIFKTWLMWGYNSALFPSSIGLRVSPEYFTLENIESNGRIYMEIGRGGWISSEQTAFFAEWDYPGNPHYNSTAVKLRAFVAAAVDMMMMDEAHDNRDGRRSDFLGGQLIMWAYPYGVAKDILPDNVKSAFEEGLIRMFEKVETWGPTGTHADMDTRSAPGMLYTAKYVDSVDLTQRAYNYIDRILNRHFKSPGYIDHGDALDGSYNGISLYHLAWAAYLTHYPRLHDVVDKMSKLKAYITLPDPNGNLISPHHSNPASSDGVTNDQWSPFFRDVGLATFSDNAIYKIKNEIYEQSTMVSDLNRRLRDYINSDAGNSQRFTTPSNSTPGEWRRRHWTETNFNYASLYYQIGSYQRFIESEDEYELPPMGRSDSFIESFDDKILSAKQNNYGVILFNDRLSWWAREGALEGLSFGGGNLSAFWTESTGTVILGVSRGLVHGGHKFEDWKTWPVHALSGETTGGNPFSSATQRHPEAEYKLNDATPNVTMSGILSNGFSDPTNGLEDEVKYIRNFALEENGVRVRTSIETAGTNSVSSLYEILPVYRRNSTSIEFEVGGNWRTATTNEDIATRIKITRFGGEVYVEFDSPTRVKLSPNEFYINQQSQSGTQIRNIMISMIDGDDELLNNQSVEYKIVSYDGVDGGPPESVLPERIELKQNFPNPFNPSTRIQFELNTAQSVSLDIYDIMGRHITNLLNDNMNAGSHVVNFDGNVLASGIYVYRLKTESGTFQKTMTLIK